jgi:hypothetical protein
VGKKAIEQALKNALSLAYILWNTLLLSRVKASGENRHCWFFFDSKDTIALVFPLFLFLMFSH